VTATTADGDGGAPKPRRSAIKVRALGILEPRGFDRRVYPGEIVDMDAEEAVKFIDMRAAEAIADKPSGRAERRPKSTSEVR
jgi:hypothetical protein